MEYKLVDFCSLGGEKLVYVGQKLVKAGTLGSNKIKKLVKKYRRSTDEDAEENSSPTQLHAVQITSLIMGLGHALGVLTLTNKTRFLMLMLNLLIIMGHFQ